MEGGTVVKAEFNTYFKFLNWMGSANDVQKITYVQIFLLISQD